jgi:hypothetical protein
MDLSKVLGASAGTHFEAAVRTDDDDNDDDDDYWI